MSIIKKLVSSTFLILFFTGLLFGQKVFENKKFGFSMREPENWIVLTDAELKKNLDKFDITEEKLKGIFQTSRGTILLTAYAKYEATKKAGLIPKVQVDIRPNGTKNFKQFKASLTRSAENIGKLLEDYEFVQSPEEITVSGIRSVVLTTKFSITMQDGQELKVRARVYGIPYKSYFFQVNMVDGQSEEDNSELFDELAKTIKIGS